MITYSIIQKSQLEGGLRLDAEYYQPEYLENAKMISALPYEVQKFSSLASYITNGHTPLHADLSIGEVYFLTAEDVFDFFIDYGTAKRITKLASTTELKRTILSDNDLLITIKGRVGNAAVVYKLRHDTNINQDVARILVKKEINPFYVSAFLNSRFGKLQVERIATNQINPFLGLGNLKELLIPIIEQDKQKKIENLIKRGLDELGISNSLYSQAENLLLEELGLKDFEIEDDLSYIVNLSEIKSSHRADAEYFQPKYDRLISKIKNQNGKLLGELVSRIKTKIKPKPEEIYKYIEISDINIGNGDTSFNEIVGKELPVNARIPIKGGELLISKVRPTRSAIAILLEDFSDNFICSSAFSVFKAPEILKEYLFVVLRSIVGKLQFEKPTTGTSYPTITDGDVENVLIPISPQPTQQKIADLVKKSHEARKKSKELLEEAKRKVEEMIQ